jgi:transcriptional regulator with GAF, ATPase, and Fis domain
MALGKRLLLFSAKDPKATSLNSSVADWGCLVSTCESIDELRGRIEGSDHDLLLLEPSAAMRRLVSQSSEEDALKLPLAEVEKRHILRVLASTGGNKTRAAKILGIDTKTLYNKLKAYKSSDQVARKRAGVNGTLSSSIV